MKILLTNDDSHNSPFLKSIIEKLETLGDLKIVLPAEEQSWKGKSMSRFEPIHLGEQNVFDRKVFTISGTPADCVNFAIYHLYESKPDLVVSGINIGLNSGACFIPCSGTIGACFEANIAEVPAIALSQYFCPEAYKKYYLGGTLEPGVLDNYYSQSKKILDILFEKFLTNPSLLEVPLTWNINFPDSLSPESQFKVTSVDNLKYGSLFKKTRSTLCSRITGSLG
ncbi:MAG: 5'/3'-nucleotidase SurE [Bdellovibrionota bacterium]